MRAHMAITIHIRNVLGALRRHLKERAAPAGKSLSDDLPSELRPVAEKPTLEELRARLQRRAGLTLSVTPAEAVRAERDRR